MPELHIDVNRVLRIKSEALIGVRIGVFGSSGSGKSNTVARIVEQVAPYMSGGTFFDFHDEAHGLMAKIPMLRVGKNPPARKDARQRSPLVQLELTPQTAADFAEYVYMRNVAVIVNLAYMHEEERQEVVLNYCKRLWELAMAYAKPYWVVLEEAHNFIPQRTVTAELDTIRRFAAEGRKFGITPILASQRTSKVNKDILSECDYLFLHRVNIELDRQSYRGLLTTEINRQKDLFVTMEAGEAVVKWWDNGNARFDHVQICRRDTVHIGATPGADPQPLPVLKSVDMMLPNYLGNTAADDEQDDQLAEAKARIARLESTLRMMCACVLVRVQPVPTDVELPPEPPASPALMTERGLLKQERAFNGLLRDVVKGCKYAFHIAILKYLVEREDVRMSSAEIARFVGMSESTVREHPPLYLCTPLALLQRTRQDGVYYYQSSARETLAERFPDLPTDELVQKLLEVRS